MPPSTTHSLAPPVPISLGLLILFLLLLSTAMFIWQVRRWTTDRSRRALLDWSREQGFALSHPNEPAGAPLDRLADGAARISTRLEKDQTSMLLIIAPAPAPPGGQEQYHLLMRKIRTTWPTTALRPSGAASSALDTFGLSAFGGAGDRFTVLGAEAPAAQALSGSPAPALLPRDIGLLLVGPVLLLDFSTRPFDGIELGRMLALAEQIEQRLPG